MSLEVKGRDNYNSSSQRLFFTETVRLMSRWMKLLLINEFWYILELRDEHYKIVTSALVCINTGLFISSLHSGTLHFSIQFYLSFPPLPYTVILPPVPPLHRCLSIWTWKPLSFPPMPAPRWNRVPVWWWEHTAMRTSGGNVDSHTTHSGRRQRYWCGRDQAAAWYLESERERAMCS